MCECHNAKLVDRLAICADRAARSISPEPTPKPLPANPTPAQESCYRLSWALLILDLQLCKGLDPETAKKCRQSAENEYCLNIESCQTS